MSPAHISYNMKQSRQQFSTTFQSEMTLNRLGRLHLNAGGLCPIRARAIMEYWQIDELLLGKKGLYVIECSLLFNWNVLDPCCALKYYPSIEECVRVSEELDSPKPQ